MVNKQRWMTTLRDDQATWVTRTQKHLKLGSTAALIEIAIDQLMQLSQEKLEKVVTDTGNANRLQTVRESRLKLEREERELMARMKVNEKN